MQLDRCYNGLFQLSPLAAAAQALGGLILYQGSQRRFVGNRDLPRIKTRYITLL